MQEAQTKILKRKSESRRAGYMSVRNQREIKRYCFNIKT